MYLRQNTVNVICLDTVSVVNVIVVYLDTVIVENVLKSEHCYCNMSRYC